LAQIYYPHQAVPIELHLIIFAIAIIAVILSIVYVWKAKNMRKVSASKNAITKEVVLRSRILKPKKGEQDFETVPIKVVFKEELVQKDGHLFIRKYSKDGEYLGEVLFE